MLRRYANWREPGLLQASDLLDRGGVHVAIHGAGPACPESSPHRQISALCPQACAIGLWYGPMPVRIRLATEAGPPGSTLRCGYVHRAASTADQKAAARPLADL